MVIRDFAGENAVFFEVFHNGARITDDGGGALFGRFLSFGVTVHEIDTVFEGRGGDVVEEAGEGLLLVVGEMPDDEGDTYAVLEDGEEVFVSEKGAVVETASHADAGEALHFWCGKIAEEPSGEFGRENLEVFASFGSEAT